MSVTSYWKLWYSLTPRFHPAFRASNGKLERKQGGTLPGEEEYQNVYRASWEVVLPHNVCQSQEGTRHVLHWSERLVFRLQKESREAKWVLGRSTETLGMEQNIGLKSRFFVENSNCSFGGNSLFLQSCEWSKSGAESLGSRLAGYQEYLNKARSCVCDNTVTYTSLPRLCRET